MNDAMTLKTKPLWHRRLLLWFQVGGAVGLGFLFLTGIVIDAMNTAHSGFSDNPYAITAVLTAKIALFVFFFLIWPAIRWNRSHIYNYYGELLAAKIVESVPSSTTTRNNGQERRIRLRLQLHPSNGGTQQANARVFAPLELFPYYRVGESIKVKWHPAYPNKVEIIPIKYKIDMGG